MTRIAALSGAFLRKSVVMAASQPLFVSARLEPKPNAVSWERQSPDWRISPAFIRNPSGVAGANQEIGVPGKPFQREASFLPL